MQRYNTTVEVKGEPIDIFMVDGGPSNLVRVKFKHPKTGVEIVTTTSGSWVVTDTVSAGAVQASKRTDARSGSVSCFEHFGRARLEILALDLDREKRIALL